MQYVNCKTCGELFETEAKKKCARTCDKCKRESRNRGSAKYYKLHKEKIKERNKKWRIDNSKRLTEYSLNWKRNNLERFQEYQKEYASRKHVKEKWIMKKHQKTHDINGLAYNYSMKTWRMALDWWGNSCAYCGSYRNIIKEHIHPFSKGGGMLPWNIIPACKSCNISKGSKDFNEWFPTRESYTTHRMNSILFFIDTMSIVYNRY